VTAAALRASVSALPTPTPRLEVTHTKCTACGLEFDLAYRPSRGPIWVCEECDERQHVTEVRRRVFVRRIVIAIVLVIVAVVVARVVPTIASDPASPYDPIAH
jgi:hypothetical protein